jgi:hypothetical protein
MTMNCARATALALLALGASAAHAGPLTIQNTYGDRDTWITTYQSGQQIQSYCIEKGKKDTHQHERYGHNDIRVRAEVMTGPACKGTKICDTDFAVDGKGTRGAKDLYNTTVYVHQHSTIKDRCYLSFSATKQSWALPVTNTFSDKWVWITTTQHANSGFTNPQVNSGCVNPGQSFSFNDDRYQSGVTVRAEVMTAAGCKGNRVCETRMDTVHPYANRTVFVRQNAKVAHECHLGYQ